MKKKVLSTLICAALVSSMASVALAQNVAVVNGVAIPKARADAIMQQAQRSNQKVTEEQVREEVIAREVFAQEAKRQGLDANPDYQAQMEFAKQNLLIRELFVAYQKNNPVSDEEITAEYDKFKANNGGKEYRARHILVPTEKEAQAVMAQLKKGAKFEDLAKKVSKDPGSGAKGGDLDWATPNNYVAEFADAITKLTKGKTTTAPVKTQFGYHIIRLDDVRDAQLPKLDEVKDQVAQQLMQQKMGKYQQELRAKAKVE